MKNVKEKRKYLIEFEAVTTNGFMVGLFEDTLLGVARAFNSMYRQTKVKVTNDKNEQLTHEQRTE